MSQPAKTSQKEFELPPFRGYLDFLKTTANFQRFKSIEIPKSILDSAASRWFTYQCFRKPNAFSGKIELRDDKIITVGGIRGGGKTGLLMNICSNWPKVIGLYGSLDDEIIALLRASKYIKKFERGLILGPHSTDVTSSWDYKYYDKITLADFETHDIIVVPQKIHTTNISYSLACEYVATFLLKRPSVTNYWFMLITEAANILWARQSLKRAKLDQAKAYLVWLLRQLRHVGVAIGMDSQYLLALDKEVRGISDYTFLKNLGAFSLPPDLEWIYGYSPPPALRALYPNEFVSVDKFGGVYMGWFKLPPWHKTPRENIYDSLGISYEFGDPELAEFEITQKGNDEDIGLHTEIIRAYSEIEANQGRPSLKGTARATGHDIETVRKHIARHQAKNCSCFVGENA